jgi:hypothetical protein
MKNVSQQSILNSEASETQNKVQKGLAYNSRKRHAIDLSLSSSNSSVQVKVKVSIVGCFHCVINIERWLLSTYMLVFYSKRFILFRQEE